MWWSRRGWGTAWEVSCQCEDGWQRLGSGGQCPQGHWQLLRIRSHRSFRRLCLIQSAPPSWRMSYYWLLCGMSPGQYRLRVSVRCDEVCDVQEQRTVMVTFNIQYFCCRGDWIWRGGQSSELFLQQDQRHYNGNVRRGTAMAWRTWTVLRDQEKSIIHA